MRRQPPADIRDQLYGLGAVFTGHVDHLGLVENRQLHGLAAFFHDPAGSLVKMLAQVGVLRGRSSNLHRLGSQPEHASCIPLHVAQRFERRQDDVHRALWQACAFCQLLERNSFFDFG
jgi:hypothetical protein